ncbi:MAG: cation transporter [Lachnospiraceae bacterium]|nr:cation transporter [Lachnospiraceae bacterium]MDY4836197.1 cation diffusion facilitator family transporter [Lachnospiraceae bacterium]
MNENMEKIAMKVSIISIIANVVLAAFKLVAGILAHSSAMVSDAIHSASDVFSTFVVMIGIKIASKEPDEEHPYGHERMECVAAIILATILCITGLGIGKNALSNITGNSGEMAVPGVLALIAAIVSIIVKEAMFWYTRHYAKKIDSGALMADAWHHRSDALSSIGAFIGIIFARMGYVMMDSIACLVICVFIVKAAYDIFKDAIDKMVDKSCSLEVEAEIRTIVMSVDGVKGIDSLSTRLFGNKMYVDIEIRADGEKTLNETHEIAEAVHDSIEAQFEKVKHIMVHVNPD